MSAALRLPGRRAGYLFVLLSLLPMAVAFHQLLILAFDLAEANISAPRTPLLVLEGLAAAAATVLLLRQGIRRIDG